MDARVTHRMTVDTWPLRMALHIALTRPAPPPDTQPPATPPGPPGGAPEPPTTH